MDIAEFEKKLRRLVAEALADELLHNDVQDALDTARLSVLIDGLVNSGMIKMLKQ